MIKTLIFSIVIFLLPALGLAQAGEVFECKDIEYITGDIESPTWIKDSEIGKLELSSTMTPLWDLKVYDTQDKLVSSGIISGVAYYFLELDPLDAETLEIASVILDVPEANLHSYQIYPISPDGGDGTGVSILEFYKLDADEKIVPAGAVVFKGWGFGRCGNLTVN